MNEDTDTLTMTADDYLRHDSYALEDGDPLMAESFLLYAFQLNPGLEKAEIKRGESAASAPTLTLWGADLVIQPLLDMASQGNTRLWITLHKKVPELQGGCDFWPKKAPTPDYSNVFKDGPTGMGLQEAIATEAAKMLRHLYPADKVRFTLSLDGGSTISGPKSSVCACGINRTDCEYHK